MSTSAVRVARLRRRASGNGPETQRDAEKRLAEFIAKFEPRLRAQIRSVRRALKRRLPTAYELVYDNYNFFVIAYSPTQRPSDSVISLTAAAKGLGLCFIHGARLPDPSGKLEGSGRQTRFIRLASPSVLADPDVASLIDAAVGAARTRFTRMGGGLIIRSVSARQRPRQRLQKNSSNRT